MNLSLRYAALSDVGRVRKDNQDSGYAGPHLLVIADGVGGAARGDVASSAAVEALRKLDVPPGNDALSELAATIHLAHDRLAEIVEQHPELDGTSTTVTAAIFDGTHLRVGHVGDSRGYLLRDGELSPITTDHTLVQSLIDEGRITEAEARVHPHRNLILRAVDGVHEPEPDLFSIDLRAGDRVLLCSDGCSGVLENHVMAELMTGPLPEAAQRLVRNALDAGSSDNVTVIVAEVTDEAPGPAQPNAGDGAAVDAAEDVGGGLVVGAAVTSPHLQMSDSTGNLSDRDIAVLSTADADMAHVDPEELRYAPRPPRRFVWVRRLLVIAVIAGLVAFGGKLFYDATQDQYYVGVEGDEVVIYRGVDLPLLHTAVTYTGLDVDDLPTTRIGLRKGISQDNLAEAEAFVANLRAECATAVAIEPTLPPLRDPTLPTWQPTAQERAVAEKCGTS